MSARHPTKLKDVRGMLMDGEGMRICTVTVRVTADEVGKGMSLSCEERGLMLYVPMEPIEGMLKEALDGKEI